MLQTFVTANGLDAVARKYHGVAIGHIDAVAATHNGGYHHPVVMAEPKVAQVAPAPSGVFGHLEFGYVNVAAVKPAGIAGLACRIALRHHLA